VRTLAIFSALFFALLCASASSAATSCPWITQGSAATALGGPVTAAVQVSDSGEGACTFTRQDGPQNSLKVVVQRTAQNSCPMESPKLKGIGNEAVLCKVQQAPNERIEIVASRVRELHFTVSLSLQGNTSQASEISRAEEAVKQIAEQVAGNLF
jgi:hypothetical protein